MKTAITRHEKASSKDRKKRHQNSKKSHERRPAEEDWNWLQLGDFIPGCGPELDSSSSVGDGTNLSEKEIAKLLDVDWHAYTEAPPSPRTGGLTARFRGGAELPR